ncbi:hypothetical protein CSKR_112974 [Clonorchis sinensis]|uniref:G-protein coupled receptors family 1 profile domain-containing protein n=1 Tax=Clonorchis sinensis TaxID=79923 RepID=A0A3R7CKC7_CLOSI|nr:hypothetical protein CSKR_112974 [Clonorchis sinensis]
MNQGEFVMRLLISNFGFVGTILNIIQLYVLCRCNISSRLTTLLLRTQSVVDAYTCFIIFIYKLAGLHTDTGIPVLNKFLCYLWSMDNLFWLGVVASVQNLTCISFDRFYAVRVPSKYKVHQTQLIVGCFLYEVAVTLFLFIPNFFLRRYQSNRCASAFAIDGPTTEQFFEVHSYLWMILNYLLPASIMVSAHGYVVYVIRKPAVGQQTGQIARKNIRRLILTTSMMAGFLVVLHSYEAIRYILGSSDIVHTEVGSVAQQIGVLFITLSAVLNPCLLVATSHTVRKQVVKNVLHFDALDASTSATNKNTDNKCCVGSICLSLKTEKISNSTTTECQLGQLGQSLRNAEYYRDKYSCFLCLINTVKEQHAMDSNHHGDSRDPKNKDNDLG